MDSLIRISGVLMLSGIGHAKDLLTGIQGYNATIHIDTRPMDVNTSLEINFSGYINNRHFTNVMLYRPRSVQKENISINSNYAGRIEGIVWSNVRFSFLLLNANFKDSGNYTVSETYFEKGSTGFLVARLILPAHPGERTTLSFKFPETNTSMIKIDFATFKFNRTVLLYNVTKENCTTTDIVIVEDMEMQKCTLKTGEFSFTFQNISWLHKGSYFAWDDKGRLLDSLFIDVGEDNKATKLNSTQTDLGTWLLIAALVITLVAVVLVIFAVRKHRTRRVLKTTTHTLTHRNKNHTHSSENGCRNLKKELMSEEIRTVSTKINSENQADLKNNKVQATVRMNDTNIYAKGFDCSKSSMRTAGKLQSDSKVLLSETTHEDDYDELKTVCLTECMTKESCICSNALGNEATESTADPSRDYDYVVQHTFMTLRPPAPDPILTMKNNKQTKIEKLLYSLKNVNIKPLSRVLPATLYAKLEKKRAMDTRCTGSSVDIRSLDLTNEFCPSCSFELENDLAKKTIDSTNVSKNGDGQQKNTARCISSHIFMYRPESSKLQDSKSEL